MILRDYDIYHKMLVTYGPLTKIKNFSRDGWVISKDRKWDWGGKVNLVGLFVSPDFDRSFSASRTHQLCAYDFTGRVVYYCTFNFIDDVSDLEIFFT